MIHIVATIVTVFLILGLFYLDRDAGVRTSRALWIPTIWLLINASRSVSSWLSMNREVSLAEQFSDSSPLDAAVFGLLILAGLLTLNFRAQRVRSFLRSNLPLVLFFTYCAISIFWSDHSVVALKRWVKAAGDFVMVLVVLTDLNPQAATKRILVRTAFVLLPLSVLMILFYPDLGTAYNVTENTLTYVGVTTFKNLLGMTCLVCCLSTLWCLIGAYADREMAHRTRHMMAHGAVLLTGVGLIIRADSMTALSCLAIGGMVMVLSTLPSIANRPAHLNGLVAVSIGLAFSALFVSSMGTLVHSLGRNSTLTGRTEIWAAVLAVHINPLLGAGFESFWLGNRLQEVWDRSMPGIQEAHNGYLELYVNLGWAGLALLGALIVTGYSHALAVFRIDQHAGRLRLALFTSGVIYSFTEAGFRMMCIIWIAFLLAITAVPPELLDEQPQVEAKLNLAWLIRRRPVRILQ